MSNERKPSEGALSAEREAELLKPFVEGPPCEHQDNASSEHPLVLICSRCVAAELDRLRQRVGELEAELKAIRLERDGEWIEALVKVTEPQFMELAKRPDDDAVPLEEVVRMFVQADRREREMKRQ